MLLEETVGAFRHRLRGPLLSPEDEGFEEAIRIWNGMIEKTLALVVQPTIRRGPNFDAIAPFIEEQFEREDALPEE